MSITPVPDLPSEPEGIQLSSIAAYAGAPGAIEGVSFWPRVGARLIDMVFHYFVSICCGLLLGIVIAIVAAMQHTSTRALLEGRARSLAPIVFALLGSIAFEALCEGFHGSTPGKMVLSMVVVQEDGSPCGLAAAWIRGFAFLIDGLFFGLIGYLNMEKTPQQQRHGDDWAGTVVCRRRSVASQNLRGSGRFVLVLFFAALADAALIMTGLLIQFFG